MQLVNITPLSRLKSASNRLATAASSSTATQKLSVNAFGYSTVPSTAVREFPYYRLHLAYDNEPAPVELWQFLLNAALAVHTHTDSGKRDKVRVHHPQQLFG